MSSAKQAYLQEKDNNMVEPSDDDDQAQEAAQEAAQEEQPECVICGNNEEYVYLATNLLGVTLLVCEHCAPGGAMHTTDLWECDCEDIDKCTHRCEGCEEGHENQQGHRCQNYGEPY